MRHIQYILRPHPELSNETQVGGSPIPPQNNKQLGRRQLLVGSWRCQFGSALLQRCRGGMGPSAYLHYRLLSMYTCEGTFILCLLPRC